MNKGILVTGAAGFIGSHLCESLLTQGHQVSGIDNFDPFYDRSIKETNLAGFIGHPSFDFIEGDAGDRNVLEKMERKPSVVIHLAAKAGVQPSLKDPSAYIRSNILMTNTVLEWMREQGIRKLLFASSSSVYGNMEEMPFREDQLVDFPVSPYAFTKRSCELMNYTYHQLYKLDVVNLRFFTVYGERQRPDLAIHKFVDKILREQAIQLYGNGDTSRDYTYWKDTVGGIEGALKYITGRENVFESINLGNNSPVKLIELVREIASLLKVEPEIVYEDKKQGDVDITYADIGKAQRLLGYRPATGLAEGLQNFITWFRAKT
ncbi:MAG TPA: NAD-dependent epimerase/dehydratase family protein [Chitinophagaceae bacterium]|nr:NAD-dependent epimerase/dehydratase family protein [Chitinophagaceae bacterium]